MNGQPDWYAATAPPSLWGTLKRWWMFLVVGLLLGIGGGFLVYWTTETTYTVKSMLLFPSAAMSGYSALTGGGSADLPGLPLLDGAVIIPQPGTSADTATLLLESMRGRKEILLRLREKRHLDMGNIWSLKDAWVPVLDKDGKPTAETTPADKLLKQLGGKLTCKTGKLSELYLEATDTDKTIAQAIVMEAINELSIMTIELPLDPARRSVAYLNNEVKNAQKQLDDAQKRMTAFQQKTLIISVAEQSQSLSTQYVQAQNDAADADVAVQTATEKVNKLSANARDLLNKCMDPSGNGQSALLTSLFGKVRDIESELALLRLKLADDNPEIVAKIHAHDIAVSQLTDEINRQLLLVNAGSSPAVSQAFVDKFATEARAYGQHQAVNTLKARVAQLPTQEAEFTRLEADVTRWTETLQMMETEQQKAVIVAQSRGPVFQVQDPPELPTDRDSRGGPKKMALGTLLGLALGLAFPLIDYQRALRRAAIEKATPPPGTPVAEEPSASSLQ
jgi:uncharacterized protein involved in exopolysaccharide biosynthesis